MSIRLGRSILRVRKIFAQFTRFLTKKVYDFPLKCQTAPNWDLMSLFVPCKNAASWRDSRFYVFINYIMKTSKSQNPRHRTPLPIHANLKFHYFIFSGLIRVTPYLFDLKSSISFSRNFEFSAKIHKDFTHLGEKFRHVYILWSQVWIETWIP